MSTDRLALAALERKTKAELQYFELVEIFLLDTTRQHCFLCVGRNAMFLVCRNLSSLFPNETAGEVLYIHIEHLVEDTDTCTQLLLVLSEKRNPARQSEELLVVCEHRVRLRDHLKAAWQTERLSRTSRLGELPFTRKELPRMTLPELRVQPFPAYQAFFHEGYRFFLKGSADPTEAMDGFVDTASNLHSASVGTYVDEEREFTFTIQVQEPQQLMYLENSGSEHVRWVAMRLKNSIAQQLNSAIVVRNAFYCKKMNLASDIASWTGWEMMLKSDTQARVVILLRRQYLPPMVDSAQDIFVSLTCPKRVLEQGSNITDAMLLGEARLAADSVSPMTPRCTVHQTLYRDMIQAKLDTLLYGDDAMEWIKGALGLQVEPTLEREARTFMKSIFKILQEESALPSPDLLQLIGEDIHHEKDPMDVCRRLWQNRLEELKTVQGHANEQDPVLNAWYARVARYFGYCLNGALLGPRFTLVDLVGQFIVTPLSQQKIDNVVHFLIHIRPKDLSMNFVNQPIRHLIHDPNLFQRNTFNDRVLQSLIELKWICKALDRQGSDADASVGHSGAADNLSLDYTRFLVWLLESEVASINLKSAVCRQLNEVKKLEHTSIICRALMHVLSQPNLHLKTYAVVTLANIVAHNESVKTQILKLGIIRKCNDSLRSSDDDLMYYSLVLMTQLSKNADNLDAMHKQDFHKSAMALLEKTPALPSKWPLLAELAGVIGQLCNRPEMWEAMCQHASKPVEKLVTTFQGALKEPAASRLRSKVMFALKSFCDPSKELAAEKRALVLPIVREILSELKNLAQPSTKMDMDFATHAVLLLGSLVKSGKVLEFLAKNKAHEVLTLLNTTELGTNDTTRDRLQRLLRRFEDELARLAAVSRAPPRL